MKATVKKTLNKREDKKRICLKWNSGLYFQIGLIVSMLAVFFVMESTIAIKAGSNGPEQPEGILDPPIINYVLDVEEPKLISSVKNIETKPQVVKKVMSTAFTKLENFTKTVETAVPPTDIPIIKEGPTVVVSKTPTTTGPSTIMNVEFVPVFPGCENLGSNREKIDCMSTKINAFINKNFRKQILENLNPNETQKIYVQFKIDSKGYVVDVVANSHNPLLKQEAQRVINRLPAMKPGKQGQKNVEVLYTVPIIFRIQ